MTKTSTTQKQLAVKIGTSQPQVSSWLLGTPISLRHAVAVKKVTKIPVEDWTVEPAAESGTDVSDQREAS